MALSGLNCKEENGVDIFNQHYPIKFLDISVGLCGAEAQIAIAIVKKMHFLGRKRHFFQKVHFIQKCSVTQNTVFQ